MPCARARRRRGHAHALDHAEGAAHAGRTAAAGACAGDGGARPAATRPPSWSDPITTRWRRWRANWRRRAGVRTARAARHRACRAGGARRDRATVLTIFSSCSPTRRWCRPQTLARLRDALARGAAVAVLGFRAADPTGYGRLVTARRRRSSPSARNAMPARPSARSRLCNAGLMALSGQHALATARRDRQCQRQGRILSHRCGRYRPC